MSFWKPWSRPPRLKYRIERKSNDKGLHRIYALVSIPGVCAVGDQGGWILGEHNLSHEGNGWIAEDAEVYDDAFICDDALIHGAAKVYGTAEVHDSAQVYHDAQVYENALVCHTAHVYDRAKVYGSAEVSNAARIYGRARVHGQSQVYRKARIFSNAIVAGTARIWGINLGKDEAVYGNETVVGSDSSIQNWKIGLYD